MPLRLSSHLVILLFTAIQTQWALSSPTVTFPANNITYIGTNIGSIEHFQSIKFSHDTSGPRRFAPPLPFTPPSNTQIDATSPGPACPQTKAAMPPAFVETKEISEDCLHLRIARPAGTQAGSNLPVVVWLHGGGVVKGSAYDPHFSPDRLLTLSVELGSPVIYVALNYRLTIFGFARTPLLAEQHSLNAGMRDQRLGLQWVKDNIAQFGGDEQRITVYGLSAGGTFASLQLMAYGGEQGVPFSQVWSMSGPPGTALDMGRGSLTEEHTSAVAVKVGCGAGSGEEVLKCLREVPMEELLDVAMGYAVENKPPAGLFTFIPSVDGDFVPERQSVLYRSGRFVKNIPMVFGWTQDDGAMNAGPAQLVQDEEAIKSGIRNFASSLDDADLAEMLRLYSQEDFQPRVDSYHAAKDPSDPVVSVHFFRLSQILRDLLFTCSSIDFASEMSEQSQLTMPDFQGTRLYALNQSMFTPLLKGAGMPYIGVSHGSDTNYIFNGVFPEGEILEDDLALSKRMTEMLIRFAATGDPNGPGVDGMEYWPKASHDGAESRNLQVQVVGGPLGTGSARLVEGGGDAQDGSLYASVAVGDDTQQNIQGYQVGQMGSKISQSRNDVLAREKLFERCAFINSLSEKLGN